METTNHKAPFKWFWKKRNASSRKPLLQAASESQNEPELKNSGTPPLLHPEKEKVGNANFLKEIGMSFDKNVESDPLNPKMNVFIDEACSSFWETGYRDGIKGIDPISFFRSGEAVSKLILHRLRVIYKGMKAKLESEMLHREMVANRCKDLVNENRKILRYKDRYPAKHSMGVAVTYFLITLALVIADLPMAILVVEQGFSMEPDKEGNAFTHGLIGHFILGIGISLIATFIKIFYDDLFGGRVSHFATLISDHEEINSEEPRQIRRVWVAYGGRKAFMMLILGLCVLTIYQLGLFRYETFREKGIEEKLEGIQENYNSWYGAHSFTEHQRDSTRRKLTNDLKGGSGSAEETDKWAFILLSFAFPMIGGICASLATSNLISYRRAKRAKAVSNEVATEWEKAEKGHNEIKGQYARIESYLAWAEKSELEIELNRHFLSFYENGYHNGYFYPEEAIEPTSYFEKVRLLRNKSVSRQVVTQVNSTFDPQCFDSIHKDNLPEK